MKNYFLLFLLLIGFSVSAQQRYTTTNSRAINIYERTDVYLSQRLYNSAIKELEIALSLDPGFLEARHRIADIYKIQDEFAKAIAEYHKVLAINPNFSVHTSFNLAECYFYTEKYDSALVLLNDYILHPDLSEKRQKTCQQLIRNSSFAVEAIKSPVPYNPVNLGPTVNTKNQEYLPTVTADDSLLIFTRKTNQEDFYISFRGTEGWETAQQLSSMINTPGNEGAQCISPDGQFLYFAACNRRDGLGKCDIYFSRLVGNVWNAPQNIGTPVNSSYWESQPSLSADGRTLYFVSDRKGGYGGLDIWKSNYLGSGKWSSPINLGPSINTEADELSPFIHPDNKTLYFGSDGWPGMGKMDIFYSRITPDGKWSKPKNLGYPINTSREESSMFISNNGKTAYFASNSLEGYGGLDLYSFELYKEARPAIVTFVKGVVFDKSTLQTLEAEIQIIDVGNGDTIVQSNSNRSSGQFLASLPAGKTYALHVNKETYLFYSDNFSLENKASPEPFHLRVPLQKIEVGGKIALKNIFYESNSYKLKNESKYELDKLIHFLKTNTQVQVEIGGHTDHVGEVQTNLTLSANRAKAVYDYLIRMGIESARLTYRGYGEAFPIDVNTTEQGRANNRRTEIKIISN